MQDMARFSEGLTDESAIRKKYRLADDVWTALGKDDDLVRAVTKTKPAGSEMAPASAKKASCW